MRKKRTFMCERTKSLRFALLVCEDSEKWQGFSENFWRQAFNVQAQDTFEIFECFSSNWPNPSKVDQEYDVLIITGSHYSAYEDIPWISALEQALRDYIANSVVRIIACCFGHQLLAKALGGLGGRLPARFPSVSMHSKIST